MDSGVMKPMRKNSTQMSLLQYTELRPLNGDKTQHAVTSMYLFFSLKRTSCLPTSEAYGKQYMETVEAYEFYFDTQVVVTDTFFVGYHTLGVDGGQHPQCTSLTRPESPSPLPSSPRPKPTAPSPSAMQQATASSKPPFPAPLPPSTPATSPPAPTSSLSPTPKPPPPAN